MSATELDRQIHDRMMRLEAKIDKVLDQLSEGARRIDAIDAAEKSAVRRIGDHDLRLEHIEATNKKALAAWGIIVLVGSAIVSVAWDQLRQAMGWK